MVKKIIYMLAAAIMIIASVTGCSQTSDKSAVKEITLSESWDFSSGFYPLQTPETSTNYGILYYAPNFYETLVNYEDGKFVAGLAESWDISADGRVYTFHLKKNVKFSDGAEFNAEAVQINLEHIPTMLGKYNGAYGTVSTLIEKVGIEDSYTVKLYLKSPYYGVLKDLTMLNPMAMVSPNAFKEDGTLSERLATETLGTGPYMYAGKTDGKKYTFERNPAYWGEAPQVDIFHVKVIADNDAKLLALRSGEIDLIVGNDKLSYDGFKEIKAAKGYEGIVSSAVSATRLLGFNVRKAPFDDRDVRLAASYGIDKAALSAGLFSGLEGKADTLFDPSMPYTNVGLKPYAFDREKAISILEEAGWVDTNGDGIREKNGVKLTGDILYISGVSVVDDLALALSAQLKELGMDIKVRGMEMMAYYAETMKNNFTVTLSKTYGLSYDPYTFVSNMNSATQADQVAAQALALVEGGDEIINKLNTTSDEKKIEEAYQFVLNEVHQNAIYVPITTVMELAVFNSSKIASYTFNGQPANVEVAAIMLK